MELIGWRGCWLDTPTLNRLRCRRMLTTPQAMSFEFSTTPILLIASKAKDLFIAMYAHPATRVAINCIRRAKELATYTFAFKEFDGATGNDKLYHHALPLKAPGDKMAACVCRTRRSLGTQEGRIRKKKKNVISTSPPHVLHSRVFCSFSVREQNL